MKKVVIIGGGFAGSTAAKHLQNKFDVTLIDNKEYFEFTPSILRALVCEKYINGIQIKHNDYLKQARFILGSVSRVDLKSVYIDKRKVDYDYLIITSGSSYNSSIKNGNSYIVQRIEDIGRVHKKLDESENILIIGGGVVGVELAAEIAKFYPKKNTTLIHSSSSLMQRNNPKTSHYALEFLKNNNINVILNKTASPFDDSNYVTNDGTMLKSDLTFFCVGIRANSSFLSDGALSKSLNHNGQINVNDYLQVEGFDNVFSCGDVSAISEEKTAQSASLAGELIAQNIIRKENALALEKYTPQKRPMIISLGPTNGIFEYKNFVFSNPLVAVLKYFVERYEIFAKRYL